MRGLLYFLAIAGIVAAQNNQTVHAPKEPPSPLTAEEVSLEAVSGGYGYPTCGAVTTTRTVTRPAVTVTKPGYQVPVTITTTCYETTTVHDTKTSTSTSTTTCTVVSRHFFALLFQHLLTMPRLRQHLVSTALQLR
jgi:hypothetical protein